MLGIQLMVLQVYSPKRYNNYLQSILNNKKLKQKISNIQFNTALKPYTTTYIYYSNQIINNISTYRPKHPRISMPLPITGEARRLPNNTPHGQVRHCARVVSKVAQLNRERDYADFLYYIAPHPLHRRPLSLSLSCAAAVSPGH